MQAVKNGYAPVAEAGITDPGGLRLSIRKSANKFAVMSLRRRIERGDFSAWTVFSASV